MDLWIRVVRAQIQMENAESKCDAAKESWQYTASRDVENAGPNSKAAIDWKEAAEAFTRATQDYSDIFNEAMKYNPKENERAILDAIANDKISTRQRVNLQQHLESIHHQQYLDEKE